MSKREIAVVGAGVIGSAVAYRLSSLGHRVVLIDRLAPGTGGASYGNVGHIAAELVEPLPSPQLLRTFWRELVWLGGPLDMPARRWFLLAPWAWRFVAAAFRRAENTRWLAPLVRPASADFASMLGEIGCGDLLRRHGHYQVWFGRRAQAAARDEAAHMARLQVPTADADPALCHQIALRAGQPGCAALHFPTCGHVLDPAAVAQHFARAATEHGAELRLAEVRAVRGHRSGVQIDDTQGQFEIESVVVCAGAWSAALLRPFGLRAPLEAAHGYHVELPGAPALVDAPILYSDQRLLVTPMAGRLRASSFMEFSGIDSAVDPRKFTRLAQHLARLGYPEPPAHTRWRGPRPVLPDYLPGIGKAPEAPVYYAIGHQHIGLTLAPVTAELVADLVQGVTPRHPVDAFDLRRFT